MTDLKLRAIPVNGLCLLFQRFYILKTCFADASNGPHTCMSICAAVRPERTDHKHLGPRSELGADPEAKKEETPPDNFPIWEFLGLEGLGCAYKTVQRHCACCVIQCDSTTVDYYVI
jgi:hypothetical protein